MEIASLVQALQASGSTAPVPQGAGTAEDNSGEAFDAMLQAEPEHDAGPSLASDAEVWQVWPAAPIPLPVAPPAVSMLDDIGAETDLSLLPADAVSNGLGIAVDTPAPGIVPITVPSAHPQKMAGGSLASDVEPVAATLSNPSKLASAFRTGDARPAAVVMADAAKLVENSPTSDGQPVADSASDQPVMAVIQAASPRDSEKTDALQPERAVQAVSVGQARPAPSAMEYALRFEGITGAGALPAEPPMLPVTASEADAKQVKQALMGDAAVEGTALAEARSVSVATAETKPKSEAPKAVGYWRMVLAGAIEGTDQQNTAAVGEDAGAQNGGVGTATSSRIIPAQPTTSAPPTAVAPAGKAPQSIPETASLAITSPPTAMVSASQNVSKTGAAVPNDSQRATGAAHPKDAVKLQGQPAASDVSQLVNPSLAANSQTAARAEATKEGRQSDSSRPATVSGDKAETSVRPQVPTQPQVALEPSAAARSDVVPEGAGFIRELQASVPSETADHLSHTHLSGAEKPEQAIRAAAIEQVQTEAGYEVTEIRLDPEELGRLRITLEGEADSLRVRVEVERPETLELLRRNGDRLADILREAGYSQSNMQFSAWSGQRQSAAAQIKAEFDVETEPAAIAPQPITPSNRSTAAVEGLNLRL